MKLRSALARPTGPLLLAATPVSAGPTSAEVIRALEKREG